MKLSLSLTLAFVVPCTLHLALCMVFVEVGPVSLVRLIFLKSCVSDGCDVSNLCVFHLLPSSASRCRSK